MSTPVTTASVCSAMKQGRQVLPDEQPTQSSGFLVGMDRGIDRGMRVLSYLLSGVIVYGFLGWLADRLLGTGFLLPLGIVLGAAGGVYMIIRRFGQVPDEVPVRRPRRRPSEEYAIRRMSR